MIIDIVSILILPNTISEMTTSLTLDLFNSLTSLVPESRPVRRNRWSFLDLRVLFLTLLVNWSDSLEGLLVPVDPVTTSTPRRLVTLLSIPKLNPPPPPPPPLLNHLRDEITYLLRVKYDRL